MKNLTITQFLDKTNQDIQNLESVALVKQKGQEITKKIMNLFPVAQTIYPADIDLILIEKGVDQLLSKSLNLVDSKIHTYDSHLIDYASGQLIISQGKKTLNHPLKPLPKLIEEDLKVNKKDQAFYLIMSYLSQNDIFEAIQLGIAIKALNLKKG